MTSPHFESAESLLDDNGDDGRGRQACIRHSLVRHSLDLWIEYRWFSLEVSSMFAAPRWRGTFNFCTKNTA